MIGEQLFNNGLTDLVSVIPPGAALSPMSKIPLSAIGKVPGRKNAHGLWSGYDWRRHQPTIEDVKQWAQDTANLGLRADRFPAVDIDCTDDALAGIIQQVARAKLGDAPVRIGKPPKRLLMYRCDEPFGRLRLWIRANGEHHLVEVLGQGQQYVVAGIHPNTMAPYQWDDDMSVLRPNWLAAISRESALGFFDELEGAVQMLGYLTEREGDGRKIGEASADQEALPAPSIDELRKVVEHIPNSNALFPSRQDYLRMGYAIKAAAGNDEVAGFDLYAAWCAKWEGNGRAAANDPAVVQADWQRIHGPYAVGFSWLAEQARAFGYNDAALNFGVLDAVPPVEGDEDAPRHSEQWLADRVIDNRGGELRFVPETGCTYVWKGYNWVEDKQLLTESVVDKELRGIAVRLLREGAAEQDQRRNLALANSICSVAMSACVTKLVRRNPAIALGADKLDADPWALNTPAGLVDLTTGELRAPDPDALCSRSTTVAPDFTGDCPRWKAFLTFATGGDTELVGYLQRLCGYALTGSTREQHLTFIWGGGGNGKGVFIRTLTTALGSYSQTSAMDVFTARSQEQHPTELADLVGARLVTAQETEKGKRWNEARIKSLTGGDEIKARFMREDFFTYRPQFKLVFTGNAKPNLRTVDAAIKRRLHLVTFPVKVSDAEKDENFFDHALQPELPAILAWMIQGCLAWQTTKLQPPESVLASTARYLEDEDSFSLWLRESCTEETDDVVTSSNELFRSWEEWANRAGEPVYAQKHLVANLEAAGYQRARDAQNRRGFRGLALKRRDLGVIA